MKIKPCPKCGREAKIFKRVTNYPSKTYDNYEMVRCTYCYTIGLTTNKHRTLEDCIDHWNNEVCK